MKKHRVTILTLLAGALLLGAYCTWHHEAKLFDLPFSIFAVPHQLRIAYVTSHPCQGRSHGNEQDAVALTDPWTMNTSDIFFRIDLDNLTQEAVEGDPLNPLHNYKNPCWMARLPRYLAPDEKVLRFIYSKRREEDEDWRLRCLPLVYNIGVTKSGTSDLFKAISIHPDVARSKKEIMWWNRKRLGRSARHIETYVSRFDSAAETIRQHVDPGTTLHSQITVDGTPNYLWDYDGWQEIPGNAGLLEPKYIMAHALKAIVPQAKLVVILRNPTSRLYSHFRMKSPEKPASLFHAWVEAVLQNTTDCLRERSARSCAYDNTLSTYEHPLPGGMFLRVGMYAVFIRHWMEVFPREQFFFIKSEEYYANRTKTMIEVLQFLDLPPFTAEQLAAVEDAGIPNAKVNKVGTSQESMLDKTRQLLDDFYRPFNEQLAQLLCDNKFRW